MGVIRVEKNKNYSVISNVFLRDKNISCKAKGLLAMVMSLPEDWDYSIEGLASITKEGRDSIMTGLQELENHGYLKRKKIREGGCFKDVEYTFFEVPQFDLPDTENPDTVQPNTDFPDTDVPDTENPTQLNKDKQNKDDNKNKDKSNKENNIIIEQEFESLWKLYPRKQGKADAKKVYLRERKKDTELFEKVKAGIEAYCEYIKANKIEQKFIKHGDSWFHQKRWEDDYSIGGVSGGEGKRNNSWDGFYTGIYLQ